LMPTYKLTPQIILAAIDGFEAQKLRIDAQIADLKAMLSGDRTGPVVTPVVAAPKRRISAAARRRMALAQQKRWAAINGSTASLPAPAASQSAKKKRKLSPAGKAAIVAALRKRWAAKKAAAKNTVSAEGPKTVKKAAAKKAPVKAAKKTAAKKTAKVPVTTQTQPTA